jgi:O-antigen ligase
MLIAENKILKSTNRFFLVTILPLLMNLSKHYSSSLADTEKQSAKESATDLPLNFIDFKTIKREVHNGRSCRSQVLYSICVVEGLRAIIVFGTYFWVEHLKEKENRQAYQLQAM